jgi:CxxC motif-containing protein (DUF1111 family)
VSTQSPRSRLGIAGHFNTNGSDQTITRQKIYFLHDGRTSDLLEAIAAHQSRESEANSVIQNFNDLPDAQKQDVLNFLRSL